MPRESSDNRSADGDREPPSDARRTGPDPGVDARTDLDAGTHPPENAPDSPVEYVGEVAELAASDPSAAGDRVGDLVWIARSAGDDARAAAGAVLDAIGMLRPEELEMWVDDLVALAGSSDHRLSFIGLRALAQLAGTNARAAAKGLDAAFAHLGAPDDDCRRAGLALVAEVGGADPDAVRRVDRPVATGLRDPASDVRMAAAMAAGRLLGADPSRFPRTADALVSALDDDDDRVREYAHVALANFALEHPTSVPEKRRAIEALAGASDRDLGLREGATAAALSGLLSLELGYDLDLR